MKCVKCGETLTAWVCGKCGFAYKGKVIRFLSVPQDVQLQRASEKNQDKTRSGKTMEEQYKRGINAFIDQDYDEALQCLQLPAENGNANAQLLMGQIFDSADGFANQYLALYWYEQAGAQGNLHAIDRLIAYYETTAARDRLEKDRFVQRLRQWKKKKETIEKREHERAMGNNARKTGSKTGKPSDLRIRTYQEYLTVLTDMYLSSGKRTMSKQQIAEFINRNDLTRRFGIHEEDVWEDYGFLKRKYG